MLVEVREMIQAIAKETNHASIAYRTEKGDTVPDGDADTLDLSDPDSAWVQWL